MVQLSWRFSQLPRLKLTAVKAMRKALDDFNYYIFEANERLNKAGIEIHIVNEQSFQTQTGKKLAEFQAGKDRVSLLFHCSETRSHMPNTA